ncbi:MAG: hypothetical protein ACFCGT_03680 [Sandaracinaceae bacterium]
MGPRFGGAASPVRRAGQGAWCLLAALTLALATPGPAAGQDERGPRLLREPHSYVDVPDAADGDDPIDVNVHVGFLQTWTLSRIEREEPSADGRTSRSFVDIANARHVQTRLLLGVEVGLFRDLALFANLPLILSDDRRLGRVDGVDPVERLQADDTLPTDPPDYEPPPLFSVPFDSPTRSGVDHVALGLAWSILNQARRPWLPTWVVRVEGRFNLGAPLRPCTTESGTTACRRWAIDEGGDWSFTSTENGGMSRGVNALRLETRASFRHDYVEPFAGFVFQMEWPGAARRSFTPVPGLEGYGQRRPPVLGRFTGGLAVIPWEDRSDAQRFAIDLRLEGAFLSEGRDYTPLFDALGTSDNHYLSNPVAEGDPNIDPDVATVPFIGLTDVGSRGEIGGSLMLELRAARFVRFQLGGRVAYTTPYLITQAMACNVGVRGIPNGDARRAGCPRGIIDPHHRPVLDLPGQRFRVNDQVRFDLAVRASGLF